MIPKIEQHWAEIQVRTELQHKWAEIFEKTADLCGRQIRYGHPPNRLPTPSRLKDPDFFVRFLFQAAESISTIEQLDRELQIKGQSDALALASGFDKVMRTMAGLLA